MKRCPECRRDYYDDSLLYCLDDGNALLEGPVTASEMLTAKLPLDNFVTEDPTSDQTVRPVQTALSSASSKRGLVLALLVLLAVGGGYLVYRRELPAGFDQTHEPRIRSLAVLPLKPLDAGDNYLGMGVADAIIRRMSQTGELIVRPTSAIRRYLSEDTDALTAARQLDTDAVLEGSIQRSEGTIRVSVNLLRTIDGVSLWNDSFDLKSTDIFAFQDTVSQQVAARLSLKLDPDRQADLTKRYTSNSVAYEYYQKAIYNFDQREGFNKQKALATVDLFRKAIDADPNYALAHAQLAYAYAVMATFSDPTNPQWAELVKVENDKAGQLDPSLAEIHLARSLILWSSYGGYQTKAAIRELLSAQQLNPNIGHAELAALFAHAGLDKNADRELERAAQIDPTSDFVKAQIINRRWLLGEYDEWLAETRRVNGDDAAHAERSVWYLLGKRRLDDARKRLDEVSKQTSDEPFAYTGAAILLALKGDQKAAEDQIPVILEKHPVQNPNYHHIAFDIACVYAIGGESEEAVRWLRKAADSGYPCYPRFEHDAYFDRVRQTPEFVRFMGEMKTDWESYVSEFGHIN